MKASHWLVSIGRRPSADAVHTICAAAATSARYLASPRRSASSACFCSVTSLSTSMTAPGRPSGVPVEDPVARHLHPAPAPRPSGQLARAIRPCPAAPPRLLRRHGKLGVQQLASRRRRPLPARPSRTGAAPRRSRTGFARPGLAPAPARGSGSPAARGSAARSPGAPRPSPARPASSRSLSAMLRLGPLGGSPLDIRAPHHRGHPERRGSERPMNPR